jgi:serine/threonine protein kinase/tetratricopeptide (TPR) repeat protein
MTTWSPRANELFLKALELPSAERHAFLDDACAGDAELRAEVESLLEANTCAGSFLESPACDLLATVDEPPLAERSGSVIGPYKLLEQIGEGGMGLVFVAEQQRPVRRRVALKLIKPGMDTREVITRFEAERQALALMDHANIAKVLDGGTTASGRPYFVMELVHGVPITQFCDEHRLSPRQRLELFVAVCQAVQHAHTRGIIHRDLKPSNVLVSQHDGAPVVKVIDFGVAKAVGQQLTDRTVYTHLRQMIGTPLYMSPEQAGMSGLDIDTRTDIYSLGAILYELLTGTTPLDKERLRGLSYEEFRRRIREEEPARPSARITTLGQAASPSGNRQSDPRRLSELLRGELDWIVMKALEKDRNRRYESASAFAADVQRYLHDEPVHACPPSSWYRFRKFARRRRVALVMGSVIGLAVLVALGGLGGSIGWALNDRAAQREMAGRQVAAERELARSQLVAQRELARSQVEAPLEDAVRFLKERKWDQAGTALEKAQALRARVTREDGEDDQPARIAALLKDWRMAQDLESIRLRHAMLRNEQFPQTDQAYARTFRAYGIDVDALRPEEAAELVRSRPIRAALVAALDDWAATRWGLAVRVKRWRGLRWGHLLAVARAADPDEARDLVRDALRRNDTQALKKLAASYGAVAGAREAPGKAAPLPAQTVVFFAEALLMAGDLEAAIALVWPAVARQPGDFWLNYFLAGLLHRNGELDAAIRFYTAALALRPNSASVYASLGTALAHKGARKEGVAALRKAIQIEPAHGLAHNNLGNILDDMGDSVGAAIHLRKAIELLPNNPEPHMNLAVALSQQSRIDAALAALAPPSWPPAWPCFAQARLAAAHAACSRALAIAPGHAAAHYTRGLVLSELGRLDQAADDFRMAIEGDRQFGLAYLQFALVLRQQGKLPEAEKVLRQAIAAGDVPGDRRVGPFTIARGRRVRPAEPRFELGLVLRRQKRLRQAEEAFRDAAASCLRAGDQQDIEIQHDLGRSRETLGRLLAEQGKNDKAEDAFRGAIAAYAQAARMRPTPLQAAELRRNLGQTYHALGEALNAQSKYAGAEAAFRSALRHLPEAVDTCIRLGGLLGMRGRPAEAEQLLRKAIALGPRQAAPHFGLGLALAEQGKYPEAITAFRTGIDIAPHVADAYAHLSRAHQLEGDFTEALKCLEEGLKRLPPNHPARPNLQKLMRNCARLAAFADRLPAVLKGDVELKDAAERINFAHVCSLKKYFIASARLYKEAFTAEPPLALEWEAGLRYSAARAAAQAGCGLGKDARPADREDRARWRRQALAWLRADFAQANQLLRDRPGARASVEERLARWLYDPALAGVRGAAIGKLPEAEREAWRRFWAEVERSLKRMRPTN